MGVDGAHHALNCWQSLLVEIDFSSSVDLLLYLAILSFCYLRNCLNDMYFYILILFLSCKLSFTGVNVISFTLIKC